MGTIIQALEDRQGKKNVLNEAKKITRVSRNIYNSSILRNSSLKKMISIKEKIELVRRKRVVEKVRIKIKIDSDYIVKEEET